MKTIKDIVQTLSTEEQERFSELIDECYQRENDVYTSARNTEKAMKTLEELSESITESLESIEQAYHELKEQKSLIEDKITRNRLTSLPDTAFFHA